MQALFILLFLAMFLEKGHSSESDLTRPSFKKTGTHIFVTEVEKDLFFCVQHLSTREQVKTWKSFSIQQHVHNKLILKKVADPTEQQYSAQNAAYFFNSALDAVEDDLFQKAQLSSSSLGDSPSYQLSDIDLWVAYAANCKPTGNFFEKSGCDFTGVEMTFAVLAQKGFPALQHMGISRNPFYKGKRHSRISTALHSVACSHWLNVYPKKIYQITCPLEVMATILKAYVGGKKPYDKWRELVIFNEVSREIQIRSLDGKGVLYEGLVPSWLLGSNVVIPLKELAAASQRQKILEFDFLDRKDNDNEVQDKSE